MTHHSLFARFVSVAAASLLALVGTAGAAARSVSSEPRFQRMRLGDFSVIALSDGRLMLPAAELLVDDVPGASHTLLAQAHAPDRVPTSVNAFLVDTGHKRFLVDTGAGDLFGAESGKLLASLCEAGYTPAQIDEVLLTHLHPDHGGGLVTHGQPTFPHAVVRLDAREAAFWLHPANTSKVGVRLRKVFKEAADNSPHTCEKVGWKLLAPARNWPPAYAPCRCMAIPQDTLAIASRVAGRFCWHGVTLCISRSCSLPTRG